MKCLALLASEKIIIDKDGAHSLINVMLNTAIALEQIAEGQGIEPLPIPVNAVMPNQWWVYTVWSPSADDVGKTFEQVYQVFWPDGEKLTENMLSFTQKNDQAHQTTFSFIGFPVGQAGRVRILTWLHFDGRRVSDMAEAFIQISHVPGKLP